MNVIYGWKEAQYSSPSEIGLNEQTRKYDDETAKEDNGTSDDGIRTSKARKERLGECRRQSKMLEKGKMQAPSRMEKNYRNGGQCPAGRFVSGA